MRHQSCQRCTPEVPGPPTPDGSGEGEPAPPSRVARLRRKLYRPLILLVIGSIPMLFVAVALVRRSLPDLGKRPEFGLAADRIEVLDEPAWVPDDFTPGVLEAIPEGLTLLDQTLCGDLAKAYGRSPWVEKVESVRRLGTGRIEVRARFRQPVAVVRIDRVSYPVDDEGVLLPAEDFDGDIGRGLPVVAGIVTSPGQPGEAWDDPVVRGTAAIAHALGTRWGELELSAIRARAHESLGKPPEDYVYELETRGGSRIVWGRAPGSDHPGELSVRQKLGKLARYLERFDSFEQPNGPYEIDIRHWREITRQRLAAGPRDRG